MSDQDSILDMGAPALWFGDRLSIRNINIFCNKILVFSIEILLMVNFL